MFNEKLPVICNGNRILTYIAVAEPELDDFNHMLLGVEDMKSVE